MDRRPVWRRPWIINLVLADRLSPYIAICCVYGGVGNTKDSEHAKKDETAVMRYGLGTKQRLQVGEFAIDLFSMDEII